ncbi:MULTISPECIES: disulfide oxidoreductase [Rummeliibacillus]|jgi:disulfide bond formation protein DsbB|uniref:disulfide oxidoreductase n=1 Tax=Rummeliibacillus TaxID=648802 RepID=UPI0011B37513|nr:MULTISPECIES: disulfide oxidoreductase [Rummeliibacillus]MBO2535190.1 disulfide bond formation protein B [Rummeliibacillus suwonensis]
MSKKLENSLLFMWVVSLIAMMGSLFFSEVQHFEPCKLCWYQRILMYPLVIILAVAYVQKNARIAVTSAIFSCLGTCTALYHYGIQKVPALQESAISCGRVPCTSDYINWLGFITIPLLSLVAFILIAGTSFYMLKTLKEEK